MLQPMILMIDSLTLILIAFSIFFPVAFASGAIATCGPRQRKSMPEYSRFLEPIELERVLLRYDVESDHEAERLNDPFNLPDKTYNESSYYKFLGID